MLQYRSAVISIRLSLSIQINEPDFLVQQFAVIGRDVPGFHLAESNQPA
jgi:hypothetical protein